MIGIAIFEWEGKQYSLDAEDAGDGLFIACKDKTNAYTTYAGGRYLQTERPQNGQVVLDFNKAFNCLALIHCMPPAPWRLRRIASR